MRNERSKAVGFEVRVGRYPAEARPIPEVPFRIAILGDFSGRANRGLVETGRDLSARTPGRVDRDNLDEMLGLLAPELRVALGESVASALALRFAGLDDFHPDHLYETLPVFRSLRDTRRSLADPTTSEQTVRKLLGSSEPAASAEPPATPADAAALLDRILAETTGAPPSPAEVLGGDLRAALRRIVSPHLVSEMGPRGAALLEQLETAIGALMRSILHHSEFQALEALWRGVDFLTRRVETSTHLQLHLIDVSKEEVAADQVADSPLEESGLFKLLVESSVGTAGGLPWAAIVGVFTFRPEPDDLLLLARLGALASLAGAPWISAAHSRFAGCESLAETPDPSEWRRAVEPLWEAVRREPQAAHLGLALPRFLLRLPYGAETDPCESFPFEELPGADAHENYLWGNPALACALLLAEAFAAAGWGLRPGVQLEIGKLPLHLRRSGGQTSAKPCAETLLSERAAGRLLELGLIPLVSVKDQDAVRLLSFRACAEPPRPLAGLWDRMV